MRFLKAVCVVVLWVNLAILPLYKYTYGYADVPWVSVEPQATAAALAIIAFLGIIAYERFSNG